MNGIRTSKVVNGVETKYYLEGNRIIFEDRNNNMIYYIYNGDEILGFVYKNKTYYYHKNIFGDIIGILDSNYKEIVSYEYDSWGALLNITDTSTINLGTLNPFRYRSYYYDTETQLYYLNSRYYNPQVGRFINADSVVLGNYDITSGNLFQYVSNNPMIFLDSSGRSVLSSILNKAKDTLKSIYKTLTGIRNSIQRTNNSNKNLVSRITPLFTMFGKSFGANNDRTLSYNEIATIERELKKSKNLEEIILTKIAQTPRNQTTFFVSDSVENTSKESFLSKGIIGKYDYRIEGTLLQDNIWNIHIYVSDTYDFTEYRWNLWNPLSLANDIAKFGTDIGIIGAYDWAVDFYITKKDIWR